MQKKLDDLQAQQEELRKTLNQLKIINDKEDANSNKNDTKIVKNNQQIRQLGSSYQGSSVKRYTGKKNHSSIGFFYCEAKIWKLC